MPGPVALFLAENIIEGIGLVVGIADFAGVGETPTGVHGIPLDSPHIEVERFSLSQSRVVVGDRINASGVLKIGLGQLVDHTFPHGEGNFWYKAHCAIWGFRIRSSGGMDVRAHQLVQHREQTPTPHNSPRKTYEVVGSGPGGYITESIGPVNERPRRLRIRKISEEGNPILRVPFNVVLQARAVGNEEIWIEADVDGYKAEVGEDAKAEARDTSERLTVEVSRPYEVSVTTAPMHVKHGEHVDATMHLTNLAYEDELLWKSSQLDGDLRGGSRLPSRKSGQNGRLINHWAEGHSGQHPCYGEETWIENAFKISPWRINELKIRLLKKPDWTDTWNGQIFEIDCVKKCTLYDWLWNWFRSLFGILNPGKFEKRGSRNYWVPFGPTTEEQGRNDSDAPKPPFRSHKSVGLRGKITPRYHIPSEISVLLESTADPSDIVEIELDESGAFMLEEWPFGDSLATLTIRAQTSQTEKVEEITAGSEVDVSLFPATRRVSGQVVLSAESRIDRATILDDLIIFAREVQPGAEEDLYDVLGPYSVQADKDGRFELSNLPVDQTLAIQVYSSLFKTDLSIEPIIIEADSEPFINIELDKIFGAQRTASIKGRFEGISTVGGVVLLVNHPDGNLLATSSIQEDGSWVFDDVQAPALVRLGVEFANETKYQSAPFVLTDDIEIPSEIIEGF